jgi:hypothetical protein
VWYEKSTGRVEFNRAEWEIQFRAPSGLAVTETQVQGQLTANADLSFTDDSGNTVTAASAQSVYIGYEVIEDLDSPNLLGFFFNFDVPSDLVAQNDTLIYQYASFRKEFTFGEWNTVACVTTVGNNTASQVINYKGWDAMSGQVSGADVLYDAANSGDKVTRDPEDGTPYFKKRSTDDSVYTLEQYGTISGTKMQKCLAQVELPKVGVDEDVFGSYEIKTGARIYKNYTETSFV